MAVPASVLAAAFCLGLPVAALAAGANPQSGACTPDAARFCTGGVSSVARTTACLVAHRAQLSAACRDVFVSTEPTAYAAPAGAERPRQARAATPARRHLVRGRAVRHGHRPARLARRIVPYHIPRFDQAEAEAEVHTQYRYRTPYLPYWVFP